MKLNMSLRQRRSLAGYLFILPWVVGIGVFVAWPLIQSAMFAFHNVIMAPTGRILYFVGFQNFLDVWLRDTFFIQSLWQFGMNTALRVPIITVISLIIAILINQKVKFQGLFRTIFILPIIIASGPVLYELTSDQTSVPLLNAFQITMMLEPFLPSWALGPVVGIFDDIVLILWFSGIQILIFLAALQKISPSLYEAAKIDGGSAWECFWKITLPTVKPVILLNLVYTLITLANSSSNQVIGFIQSNIFDGRRGYGFATAMAWMYAVIIAALLGIIALFFIQREDRKIKIIKRLQNKERRIYLRTQKTIKRNEVKMAKKLKKQPVEEMKSGKGGGYDD